MRCEEWVSANLSHCAVAENSVAQKVNNNTRSCGGSDVGARLCRSRDRGIRPGCNCRVTSRLMRKALLQAENAREHRLAANVKLLLVLETEGQKHRFDFVPRKKTTLDPWGGGILSEVSVKSDQIFICWFQDVAMLMNFFCNGFVEPADGSCCRTPPPVSYLQVMSLVLGVVW